MLACFARPSLQPFGQMPQPKVLTSTGTRPLCINRSFCCLAAHRLTDQAFSEPLRVRGESLSYEVEAPSKARDGIKALKLVSRLHGHRTLVHVLGSDS